MKALVPAAVAALWVLAAGAQEADGVPDPGMPEGAEETLSLTRDQGAYRLPLAPVQGGEAHREEVLGRVVWRAYRMDGTSQTTAAVMSGYRERLEAMGFELLLDCADTECGGFDFRYTLDLLPAPDMLVDVADYRHVSARRPGEAITVLVSRVLDRVFVQTVAVLEAAPVTSEIVPSPTLSGTEGEELFLPSDAKALRRALERDGHLQVRGLAFEVGGARLTETSGPALDALAQLLRQDDAMEIVIVGHSDNQGGLEINRSLSRERAVAVMEALVARGVPDTQLEAEGVGFLAPIATNTTAEGRARNRRVELVLK